jgi:hypothetical protein
MGIINGLIHQVKQVLNAKKCPDIAQVAAFIKCHIDAGEEKAQPEYAIRDSEGERQTYHNR